MAEKQPRGARYIRNVEYMPMHTVTNTLMLSCEQWLGLTCLTCEQCAEWPHDGVEAEYNVLDEVCERA